MQRFADRSAAAEQLQDQGWDLASKLWARLGSKVEARPAGLWQIRINPARHPVQSENVHREECQIETDEHQPEVQVPQRLAEHSPGPFWKPVVRRTEQRKHCPADQHVMQVRDHEHRVVNLAIDRN